jgi:hypothetical protein
MKKTRVDLGGGGEEMRQALVDDFQLGALVAPDFLVGGVEDAQREAGEEQRDQRRVAPQARRTGRSPSGNCGQRQLSSVSLSLAMKRSATAPSRTRWSKVRVR